MSTRRNRTVAVSHRQSRGARFSRAPGRRAPAHAHGACRPHTQHPRSARVHAHEHRKGSRLLRVMECNGHSVASNSAGHRCIGVAFALALLAERHILRGAAEDRPAARRPSCSVQWHDTGTPSRCGKRQAPQSHRVPLTALPVARLIHHHVGSRARHPTERKRLRAQRMSGGCNRVGGFRACPLDCQDRRSRSRGRSGAQACRPCAGRRSRRAPTHRPHICLGRGGTRQSLRCVCRVHEAGQRQSQHPDGAGTRRARRGGNLRSHGERFRADRRRRSQTPARSIGLRKLCLDGRAAAEICRGRSSPHPSMGNHRLRARRQGRRAKRYRPRAGVPLVEGAQSRAHGSSGEHGRSAGSTGRHGLGLPGPFRSACLVTS